MSASRAHLRVFDAFGGRRTVVPLEKNYYEIGGDRTRANEQDYVYLEGAGTEARHARMMRRRNSDPWQVTIMGGGEVKLGRQRLERGSTHELSHGTELWIGSNLIQLLNVSESVTGVAHQPELADLEMMLNEALLEFEDRRRDVFEGSERQREMLLSEELDRLLGEELDAAAGGAHAATLNRFCSEALKRQLISSCLMSGQRGDIELAYSQLNNDQRAQTLEMREELASELKLSMEPHHTEDDLKKLQAGFDAAYANVSALIPETLKKALIRDAAREKVLGLFFRLGPIQFLCDIPIISEIMVCGHDRVFVEKWGSMFETGLEFASERELFTVAARIAGLDGKQLTEGSPLADARLPDGSRSNIVASPTALNGISLTIRKFGNEHRDLAMLRGGRTLNLPMEKLLRACVLARKNIIVSGGTGSGKTTLLNALSMYVPNDERIVTIEDTAELRLLNRNLVTLEGRRANTDGKGEISIRDLVKNALRMRPDRIIVGECRGGETLDMLQAMNTGHSGSMTTAHANSPQDLILRLETMVMQSGEDLPIYAIRQQISAAIDIIIQVRKTASMNPNARPGEKQRTIVEIAELGEFDPDTGNIPVNPIFEVVESGERPSFTISGYIPSFFQEMVEEGHIDVSDFFDPSEEASDAA